MGQALPLPERIPRPNEEQSIQLRKKGIVCLLADPCQYVTYTLPQGWQMLDRGQSVEKPHFVVVDTNYAIHLSIWGELVLARETIGDDCGGRTEAI
jgi:hypothetical protein